MRKPVTLRMPAVMVDPNRGTMTFVDDAPPECLQTPQQLARRRVLGGFFILKGSGQ